MLVVVLSVWTGCRRGSVRRCWAISVWTGVTDLTLLVVIALDLVLGPWDTVRRPSRPKRQQPTHVHRGEVSHLRRTAYPSTLGLEDQSTRGYTGYRYDCTAALDSGRLCVRIRCWLLFERRYRRLNCRIDRDGRPGSRSHPRTLCYTRTTLCF